ncbi:MAG TPA: hypothetical protein VMU50_01300 [Polyangia bacterium]|nr:hypothetical protein [Polyangia bacterium]
MPLPRDGGPDGDLPIPPPPTVAGAVAASANPIAALPDGGMLDGGGSSATGSSTANPTRDDWQDTIDRHPVADHAIAGSAFDDEDRVNEHPTGP